MESPQPGRVPFDTGRYAHRSREGPCFVCAILHWHIAPLPSGVPYRQQRYYALMAENGVLDVDDSTQAALAQAIRSRL